MQAKYCFPQQVKTENPVPPVTGTMAASSISNTSPAIRFTVPNLKNRLLCAAQILLCQNERVGDPLLKHSSAEALQLEAFVRRLALGETVNVDVSGELAPYNEAGKKLFHTRWGQVDIACHQCHVYHAGRTFRGQTLSQGQSNGFPGYRYTEGKAVSTSRAHHRMPGKSAC